MIGIRNNSPAFLPVAATLKWLGGARTIDSGRKVAGLTCRVAA